MEFCTDYILYPHAVSLWQVCWKLENVFLYYSYIPKTFTGHQL